jgi:succinate-acetate transporter protein
VLTALVAWYASAAIVVNTMRGGAPTLPVGKPLWPARQAA